MMEFPPNAGDGLHAWILRISRQLILQGKSDQEVFEQLFTACQNRGRPADKLVGEIWDAINGVVEWMAENGISSDPEIRQEDFLFYKLANIPSDKIDRQDNRPEYLPIKERWRKQVLIYYRNITLRDWKSNGKFSYDELFELDWNLCFCKEVYSPVIKPFSDWSKLNEMQFTVPSPFLQCGIGGRFKCDKNMAKRIYQVIEFDKGTIDEQARLLWYLSHCKMNWFLAMIVFSGGKSLHGWFPCYHKTPREIRTFFLEATKLGADPMTRIPSQYVRVPNGWNYEKEGRQKVLYWNGELIQEHNEIIRAECMSEK